MVMIKLWPFHETIAHLTRNVVVEQSICRHFMGKIMILDLGSIWLDKTHIGALGLELVGHEKFVQKTWQFDRFPSFLEFLFT